jgi:hypothetical protein
MSDAKAKEQFDIRCQLCNWSYHVNVKFGQVFQISWKGAQGVQ